MKRILICLALFCCGCGVRNVPTPDPLHKPLIDHTITLNWSQSFVNNVACSSIVTTSCISGFNEGYVVGTVQTQLHTDTNTVCTGTTQPLSCTSTFNGIIPIGNDVFYVATTYFDQNGVAGVSPASFSPGVAVGADSATNVKATVQ